MSALSWVYPVAVTAAVTSASFAHADDSALPEPLTVEVVTTYAREHRAEIRAAQSRSQAGWGRAGAAGKPPDPMLMTNLDHLPVPEVMGADGSFMLQQSIPLSGELGARVRRAEWQAKSLEQDARTVELDVELEAANAFVMLAEEQAMLALVGEQIALLRSIEKVIEARLSTGSGTPADLLRAQLERARLEVQQQALEGRIKRSDAMLDATLGRRPDASVPTCVYPASVSAVPDGAELARAALARRPELASMQSRINAAEEDIEVMRNMRAPMGIFGIGAAFTMTDGFGLMTTVGISIPIWAGEYDSAIDEAKSMASMEKAEQEAMSTMIEGTVVAERERLETARLTERAIRTKLLPQSEQVLEALLTAYAGGSGSVLAVLDGFQAVQMVQMEHITARSELARAQVALDRVVGSRAVVTTASTTSDGNRD